MSFEESSPSSTVYGYFELATPTRMPSRFFSLLPIFELAFAPPLALKLTVILEGLDLDEEIETAFAFFLSVISDFSES